MQVEIKVPVLPESVTEGTLGDWHKQVGDSVAVDENIVDLETDKVVLEIVAQKAGVIESIAFASGDTVKDGEAKITGRHRSVSPSFWPSFGYSQPLKARHGIEMCSQ